MQLGDKTTLWAAVFGAGLAVAAFAVIGMTANTIPIIDLLTPNVWEGVFILALAVALFSAVALVMLHFPWWRFKRSPILVIFNDEDMKFVDTEREYDEENDVPIKNWLFCKICIQNTNSRNTLNDVSIHIESDNIFNDLRVVRLDPVVGRGEDIHPQEKRHATILKTEYSVVRFTPIYKANISVTARDVKSRSKEIIADFRKNPFL